MDKINVAIDPKFKYCMFKGHLKITKLVSLFRKTKLSRL